MLAIGGLLRRKRKSASMTLAEMSDRCGVAPGRLSEIERDLRMPGQKTLRRLAIAYGLHPEALVEIRGYLLAERKIRFESSGDSNPERVTA